MDHSHLKPTLISYICIFLGLGWIITLPCTVLVLPIFWIYSRSLFTVTLGIVISSALFTVDRRYQPSWGYRIGNYMMSNVSSYFQFRIEAEDPVALEKIGPAIHIMEPHAVFPIAIFWGSLNLIPNQKMLCCLSSAIFTVPLMKHFLTWCGATTIDKENISSYLKSGTSVNICAGGVQEIQYWGEDKELVLFLRSRLGVTKLALTHGVCLVPALTFGLKRTYDCWIFKHPVLVKLGRSIGFFPMLFTGLFGVPFGQPKPAPLVSVIGTPIHVPLIANPTSEDIQKYHDILLAAYEKLYDNNKAAHGMEDVILRIV